MTTSTTPSLAMLHRVFLELQKDPASHTTRAASFFKTGPGDYAEHDRFLGIKVPVVRRLAQQGAGWPLELIGQLMYSSFNEERLLGLLVLVLQHQRADRAQQDTLFQFYVTHKDQVNNWNLVDSSAPALVGAHLWDKKRTCLFEWAQSPVLWHRRIAVVSTLFFIKNNDVKDTLRLASVLMHDPHDLIHKAVGWMLREVGVRDTPQLVAFLKQHAPHMPRTMLRYAIEHCPEAQRRFFLAKK